MTIAAEVDTSFPQEDGSLPPQELIIRCLPGPTFKCQVLKLHDCGGAKRGFTKHENAQMMLIVLYGKLFGGPLNCLFCSQLSLRLPSKFVALCELWRRRFVMSFPEVVKDQMQVSETIVSFL